MRIGSVAALQAWQPVALAPSTVGQRYGRVEHTELGRIEGLFFVPCYEDDERRDYHVTIN